MRKFRNLHKLLIKKVFNILGFDIMRLNKSPRYTLIGLKQLPIRTIIDVGANEGQFAKQILKVFPNATVYSFEPLPEVFKKLEKWAKTTNGKVKCFNLALGKEEKEIEMFYHVEHSPSSSILKTTKISEKLYPFTKSQNLIKVRMDTLDNTIQKFRIDLIPEILIKLDVQGYEDRVIRGGKETFTKAKACIVEVNIFNLYEEQANFKDIVNLLWDYGFFYYGILDQAYDINGQVIYFDAIFIKK